MSLSASLRTSCFALTVGISLTSVAVGCDRDKKGDATPESSSSAEKKGPNNENAESEKTKDKTEDKKSASAKEAAKIISALPEDKVVQPIINPKKLDPYKGPTGNVRGIVRVTGDEAPELPKVVAKMEENCDRSQSMFGKVFREGPERALADVLVAVTHYEGFVPAEEKALKVWGKGCAWEQRTYAMTYGMQLEIDGADNRPYVPELLGQPMPAQLFVLPTAPAVKLPPKKPGRFKLVDSMRLYNVSELFVLPYATMDVTGTDGTFEIKGIPVGDVQINALSPQTGITEEKKITIAEGKTTEVEFELKFDRAAWDKKPKPKALDEIPAPGEGAP